MASKVASDLSNIAGLLLGTVEADENAVSRNTEQFLVDQRFVSHASYAAITRGYELGAHR